MEECVMLFDSGATVGLFGGATVGLFGGAKTLPVSFGKSEIADPKS